MHQPQRKRWGSARGILAGQSTIPLRPSPQAQSGVPRDEPKSHPVRPHSPGLPDTSRTGEPSCPQGPVSQGAKGEPPNMSEPACPLSHKPPTPPHHTDPCQEIDSPSPCCCHCCHRHPERVRRASHQQRGVRDRMVTGHPEPPRPPWPFLPHQAGESSRHRNRTLLGQRREKGATQLCLADRPAPRPFSGSRSATSGQRDLPAPPDHQRPLFHGRPPQAWLITSGNHNILSEARVEPAGEQGDHSHPAPSLGLANQHGKPLNPHPHWEIVQRRKPFGALGPKQLRREVFTCHRSATGQLAAVSRPARLPSGSNSPTPLRNEPPMPGSLGGSGWFGTLC